MNSIEQIRMRTLVGSKILEPKPSSNNRAKQTCYTIYCKSVKLYVDTNKKEIKLSPTILSHLWDLVKKEHIELFQNLAKKRNMGNYEGDLCTIIDHEKYLITIRE